MTHEFTSIGFDRDGDVLIVTIDHPTSSVNAVDHELHADLTALFPRLQREREARAVLLTGRGRAFSAGGDFEFVADSARIGDPHVSVGLVAGDGGTIAWPLAFAHRLAAGAPLAVQFTKQAVNAWIKATAAVPFDLAQALELTTFTSADHIEALTALAEKRPPRFEGK